MCRFVVEGYSRLKIVRTVDTYSHQHSVLLAEVEVTDEEVISDKDAKKIADKKLDEMLKKEAIEFCLLPKPNFNASLAQKRVEEFNSVYSKVRLSFMACSLLQSTSVQEKQKLLETNSVAERMEKCMIFLKREGEILKKMGNDEGKSGLGGLTRRNTNYSPLTGLGSMGTRGRQDKEDIEKIKKKFEGVELPEETKQIVERELKKLEKMSENN